MLARLGGQLFVRSVLLNRLSKADFDPAGLRQHASLTGRLSSQRPVGSSLAKVDDAGNECYAPGGGGGMADVGRGRRPQKLIRGRRTHHCCGELLS